MKEEDKLYIESYVCKLVSLCAEADYRIDKFGNIVFKDKNKVKNNIKKVILDASKELELSEDEVRNYLIKIYSEKIINPEFTKEGEQLISLFQETVEQKEDKKVQEEKEEIR